MKSNVLNFDKSLSMKACEIQLLCRLPAESMNLSELKQTKYSLKNDINPKHILQVQRQQVLCVIKI